VLVLVVLIAAPSALAEEISYTWNSDSGTGDEVVADYGVAVMFVTDTVNATDIWTWAVNGSLYQTGASNSCNVTFVEFDVHNVSVYGTGAYGVTPDHVWVVVCHRELATGSVETFPDHSVDLQDSISGEPDFEEFCKVIVSPFTGTFGSIFYLFVFGTPLLMLYIRQDSLATPTTIMFLFGSMMLFMLPAQWQAIGGALMVLGLLGALFKLFKERER
jgi:hypothetical protein